MRLSRAGRGLAFVSALVLCLFVAVEDAAADPSEPGLRSVFGAAGSCDGIGDGIWDGCRGTGCSVCAEKLGGFDCYFDNHPDCILNVTCEGRFFSCDEACPPPSEEDRCGDAEISLEIVDPNPDLLVDGAVTTQEELLAVAGRPVVGATTDGATRVLLRATTSEAGRVEFSLEGGSVPADGGFAQVGEDGRNGSVLDQTTEIAEDEFRAFALYRVPDRFPGSGGEKTLQIRAELTTDDDSTAETSESFRLIRPPLVFLHGLWSDAGTWRFPLPFDLRFQAFLVDYSRSHARSFATNEIVPVVGVTYALESVRDEGFAATRVDVLGHSMGGILARNHTSLPSYRRGENFNEGDFHRLFTLNTPHTGSPLANLLQALANHPVPPTRALIRRSFRAIDRPIDQGAIDDLAKGSAALGRIQPTPVPAHAFVGVGGSDLQGPIYALIDMFGDKTGLFGSLQHDLIVGRDSQEGGMPPRALTVVTGLESLHFNATGSVTYSSGLTGLLNVAPDDSPFAEFPAPSSLLLFRPAVETAVFRPLTGAIESSLDGLTLAGPAPGSVVAPGETVLLTVTPDSDLPVTKVLVAGPDLVVTDDLAPFQFDLTIPEEAAGRFDLFAVGTDGEGAFFGSNDYFLQVDPPADLLALTTLPRDPVLLGPGAGQGLTVLGEFADGATRNVTDPLAGTTFESDDPAVVTVSTDGVLTAVEEGEAGVTVHNRDLTDEISVTVLPGRSPPLITTLEAVPDSLWPPDHRMVPVHVEAAAVDVRGNPATCRITGVESSEDVPARGSGATDPDWTITGDLTVDLRAERAGPREGRTYTIQVECVGANGIPATADATVEVAHDQR